MREQPNFKAENAMKKPISCVKTYKKETSSPSFELFKRQGEYKSCTFFVGRIEDESATHQLGRSTNEGETNAQSFFVVVELEEWDEHPFGILFSNANACVSDDKIDIMFIFQTALQRDGSLLRELIGIVEHLRQHSG